MVHECDVYCGAAKTESAELEKEQSDFFETPRKFNNFYTLIGRVLL
jgi:hypothetical protein